MKKITKLASLLALSLSLMLPLSGGVAFADGGGGGGSFGGSSNAPRYDPVEEYKKGAEALRAGNYKKASRAFGKVLKVARKDANTHYLMGLAQTGLGKSKKAARYYKNATKYNPDLYQVYPELVTAYMADENTKKASAVLTTLDARIASCGDNCAAGLISAQAKVATILDGSIVQSSYVPIPKSEMAADVQYFKAVTLINQAKFSEAIVALNQMAATHGPHPDVMNYLGYSHRKLQMFDRAEAFYRIALAVDPIHTGANEYLGELYVETGQLDKAKVQLAKLGQICSFGCVEEVELRGWIADAAP
ncbi:MAG: tetratricopeptide repeat protein [Robiginitomaculum sp.]|nr:tetratricopeptide repeat protein [Robiginitomaculum sp.]